MPPGELCGEGAGEFPKSLSLGEGGGHTRPGGAWCLCDVECAQPRALDG
jgi:hypothetical protein